MVIDCHTHIASADRARYPINPTGLGSDWYERQDVDITALLRSARACSVDGIVVVQGLGAYQYDCSYAIDAVREHSAASRFIGAVDMNADDLASALVMLSNDAGDALCGVRVFGVGPGGAPWLHDDRSDVVWSFAERAGVCVTPTIFPDLLPVLAEVVARHPRVPVLLEHSGFVDWSDGPPFAAARPLFELSRYPNVFVKVTTHTLEQALTLGDPAIVVDALTCEFGASRLAWGSDHPQAAARSYRKKLELARHAARRLSRQEVDMFLGGTVRTVCWEN